MTYKCTVINITCLPTSHMSGRVYIKFAAVIDTNVQDSIYDNCIIIHNSTPIHTYVGICTCE